MRPLALLCVLALGCGPAYPKQPPLDFAQLPGPGPEAFSSDAELIARWPAELEPAWSAGRDGSFVGRGGVSVHWHVAPVAQPKGAVVLLPGRTESVLKYAELAWDLGRQGYPVYAMDLRGQGASQRMLPDPDKGYVADFEDYVADLDQFVREVVTPDGWPRVFLLAHSTGGPVAIWWADRHASQVAALALSSPMLEIDTGAFPSAVAASLAATDCSISDGTGYVLGQGPYERETDPAASTVTHSEPRWAWAMSLYDAHPELRLGGATFHWLCEALRGSSYASKLGRYSNLPTVVFEAGEDSIVRPRAEEAYCQEAARCQLTRFAEGKHELLQELDPIRNLALSQVVKLFDYVGAAK